MIGIDDELDTNEATINVNHEIASSDSAIS